MQCSAEFRERRIVKAHGIADNICAGLRGGAMGEQDERNHNSVEEHRIFCHVCPSHCSRKITVKNKQIIDVDRDDVNGFPTEWCSYTRGRIIKEVCSHPDRLKYPQKRAGAKGEGKWVRISWDEALGEIAEKLSYFKDKYGAESVAFCIGEPKGMETAFGHRLASVFGTPNVATPGNY
jgi:anaerobic selenocysteine-containing dehydrogenase